AYAVAAACTALTEAGPEHLAAREEALLERLLTGLAALPGIRVLSLFGSGADRVGVVSFTAEGWHSSHLAAALSAEYGIGVRDGLFCAPPLVRPRREAEPTEPGECGAPQETDGQALSAVRVSFGAGTPEEHVERFL
ncbi:cysteine desulfurase, partial [Streptomyces sp. NRRL WC-3753]